MSNAFALDEIKKILKIQETKFCAQLSNPKYLMRVSCIPRHSFLPLQLLNCLGYIENQEFNTKTLD